MVCLLFLNQYIYLNLLIKYDKMILRRNNIITPSIKLCLFFAKLVKTQALLGVVLYWLKLCRSNQRAMCFLRVVLRSCAFFDLGRIVCYVRCICRKSAEIKNRKRLYTGSFSKVAQYKPLYVD